MKHYDAAKAEQKIKKFWEKQKIYKFDSKKKNIYSIDTPPPTVSGDMHVGHAFSYAQEDFIVRYRRMANAGKAQVFYPFGTDDNGLPTERLVEKLNNVKSKQMSRKDFIDLCLKTLRKITPGFIQQWKDLGVSADYDICYSTIDKNSQKISQKSFLDLFKAGRIYQAEFPTLWCPECQTAIAQAELEDKELGSQFSTVKFESGGKLLPVATTRPELIPACVAIFINPKDKRFGNLEGKKAKVPLFNYEVPILKDDSADIEKGTGVMMVCSYGDKFDVDAINKYKLKPKIIFNYDGTLNFGKFKDMKIKDARKKILEELKEKGLVLEQKQISHVVNVHDKCGTEIEFLPTKQWFIKILDKKKALIAQGKKVKWYPKYMYKRYENWVSGLDWDWSISRDRHFGISIPAWHCRNCDEVILPNEKELPVDPTQTKKSCKKCGNEAEPEKKVLDTWATSSLTPQIASSFVDGKIKIKIPYSLRPQAHDIIRTWAFYTIVKSFYHEKKIPWNNIMVSGFVTLGGEKLSKSKGVVVNPMEIISNHSADALRFWAAGSGLGEDLEYQEKDILTGRRLMTKLWNASNFVFMNLKDYDGKKRPRTLTLIDGIFLKKLHFTTQQATEYFLNYEYSRAKREIEQFFWRDFCDNYLEIVKKRVYNEKGDKKLSAQYTLYQTLLYILKMIAPIMPFITEEIYQTHYRKFEKDKSIHVSKWPDYLRAKFVKDNVFDILKNVLSKIRGIKTENKKSMNAEIVLTLEKNIFKRLESVLEDLKAVTNAREIKKGPQFKVEFL